MNHKRASLLMGAGFIVGGLVVVVAAAGWVLESLVVDELVAFSARVGRFATAGVGVIFVVVGLLRRR